VVADKGQSTYLYEAYWRHVLRNYNPAYESGGLSEGLADVFGTLVEFYVGARFHNAPDKGDWVMCDRAPSGCVNLRLDQPSLTSPPAYSSPDWWYQGISSLGEYRTAGPVRHLGCYLVIGVPASGPNHSPYITGSNPPMPTFNGARQRTAEILFYSLPWLNDDSDYEGMRVATGYSAIALGYNGSLGTLLKAWKAVNVNHQHEPIPRCRPPVLPCAELP
jgi:Zn-dependent metalloprotease